MSNSSRQRRQQRPAIDRAYGAIRAAPGFPAWNGKHATVEWALKLIAQGALEQQTEDAFAEWEISTARHLRRLFEQEFGHTPKQLHDNALV